MKLPLVSVSFLVQQIHLTFASNLHPNIVIIVVDDLGIGDLTLLLGTPLFWFKFFFLSLWNPAARRRDSSFSVIVFDFLTPLASVEFLTGKPFKLVFDPNIKVFEATVATSSPQGSVLSLKKLKKKL